MPHGDRPRRASPRRRRVRRATLLLLGALALLLMGLTVIGAGRPTEPPKAPVPTARATHGAVEIATGSARRAFQVLRNAAFGEPRVAIQIGHELVERHPEELARLRVNTGGLWQGRRELDVNRAVALALAERLERHGVQVELLPATVPPDYRADLLLSLHADASPQPWRQGYKSAHFSPPRNPLEPELKRLVDDAYLRASGLPDDTANVTSGMFRYYAFNHRRYEHAVSPHTPAVIVEMGYISHPRDLAWLSTPDRPAAALEEAVLAFLEARGRLPVPTRALR